jgi:hypothetical protein
MPEFPETPEGVALVLFAIIAITTVPTDDIPRAAWLLDLYADCLRAAQGLREKVDGGAH